MSAGHNLSQKSLGSTEAVYTSVFQTGLPHKSTFTKDGRNVKLEIIKQDIDKSELSAELDISKAIRTATETLRKYNILTKHNSLPDLNNSSGGLNYYFNILLMKQEKLIEEEKDSRFAYRNTTMKNGVEFAVKFKEEIGIPGLSWGFDVNVGVCKYKGEFGGFVGLKSDAKISSVLSSSHKEYINDEKPIEDSPVKLGGEATVGFTIALAPKIEVDLCGGAKAKATAVAEIPVNFMKIKEPDNSTGSWISFPFINKPIVMTPYFEYEVKVGDFLKYKGSINGDIITLNNIFK